jgi:hypothetical protein
LSPGVAENVPPVAPVVVSVVVPVAQNVPPLTVAVGWHAVTVNVADVVAVWHALLVVHITVTVPPAHAAGADAGALLVRVPGHPPLLVTLANHELYAASIAACVWQPVVVVFAGAVNVIVVAAGTVNVAVAVTLAAHELVAVHVTVAVPPHAEGAAVLLFVTDTLHPPLLVTPVNHEY